MLWEVEIHPRGEDAARRRIAAEHDLLTHSQDGANLVQRSSRGYLVEGDLSREQAERLSASLLVDQLVEEASLHAVGQQSQLANHRQVDVKPRSDDDSALSVT